MGKNNLLFLQSKSNTENIIIQQAHGPHDSYKQPIYFQLLLSFLKKNGISLHFDNLISPSPKNDLSLVDIGKWFFRKSEKSVWLTEEQLDGC